jgi:hypothetical protein
MIEEAGGLVALEKKLSAGETLIRPPKTNVKVIKVQIIALPEIIESVGDLIQEALSGKKIEVVEHSIPKSFPDPEEPNKKLFLTGVMRGE